MYGTVSKAFKKSRMTLSTYISLDLYVSLDLVVLLLIVSHMNIHIWSNGEVCMLWFSRCPNMCLHVMCSMIWQHVHIRNTSLQFSARSSFPFNIEAIIAFSQSSGNVQIVNDCFKISVSTRASSIAFLSGLVVRLEDHLVPMPCLL